MTQLSDLILARLRAKGDRVIRARDLYRLAHGLVENPMRYTDQTIQRMRKGGLIRYDSKLGWLEVVVASAASASPEATRRDTRTMADQKDDDEFESVTGDGTLLTNEGREQIRRQAAEAGMSVRDYLANRFKGINAKKN